MVELNDTESKIYEFVKRSTLTTNALMHLTGKSREHITQILKKLNKHGMVDVIGRGRNVRYQGVPK